MIVPINLWDYLFPLYIPFTLSEDCPSVQMEQWSSLLICSKRGRKKKPFLQNSALRLIHSLISRSWHSINHRLFYLCFRSFQTPAETGLQSFWFILSSPNLQTKVRACAKRTTGTQFKTVLMIHNLDVRPELCLSFQDSSVTFIGCRWVFMTQTRNCEKKLRNWRQRHVSQKSNQAGTKKKPTQLEGKHFNCTH